MALEKERPRLESRKAGEEIMLLGQRYWNNIILFSDRAHARKGALAYSHGSLSMRYSISRGTLAAH